MALFQTLSSNIAASQPERKKKKTNNDDNDNDDNIKKTKTDIYNVQ